MGRQRLESRAHVKCSGAGNVQERVDDSDQRQILDPASSAPGRFGEDDGGVRAVGDNLASVGDDELATMADQHLGVLEGPARLPGAATLPRPEWRAGTFGAAGLVFFAPGRWWRKWGVRVALSPPSWKRPLDQSMIPGIGPHAQAEGLEKETGKGDIACS